MPVGPSTTQSEAVSTCCRGPLALRARHVILHDQKGRCISVAATCSRCGREAAAPAVVYQDRWGRAQTCRLEDLTPAKTARQELQERLDVLADAIVALRFKYGSDAVSTLNGWQVIEEYMALRTGRASVLAITDKEMERLERLLSNLKRRIETDLTATESRAILRTGLPEYGEGSVT